MTTPPDPSSGVRVGHVGWEVVEVSTGQVVHRGHREVRTTEVETRINSPLPFPRLGSSPREVAAGLFGWLVTRGGARTVKRLRLGGGFWLVLPERPGPKRPGGLALLGQRDGERTFCWESFELDDGGATATKLQETGTLQLQWARNRHGHHEVTQTIFLTDVSLRLLPSNGSDTRHPRWRVRVLSGSVVAWPECHVLQLVAQLRPVT